MKRANVPAGVVAVERPLALGGAWHDLPVLWWVPTATPLIGVAWLQHGYARDPRYLNSLAGALARSGMVVAMPTVPSFRRTGSINDNQFLDAIGAALPDLSADDGPLRAAITHAGVELDDEAAERLVLVAHSAGCAVIARAAVRALRDGGRIDGIVLLDATDNLAKSFASSVYGLGDCTVRGLFAAPSRCNRQGLGAKALREARDGHVGLRLTSGTHCDAEGHDTDRVCKALCGTPDPTNVDLLFEITSAWTTDLALGHPTPAWEPGGERLEDEIAVGRIAAL